MEKNRIKNFNHFLLETLKSDAIGYNIGDYIYHVSPVKNLTNILESGFIPKSGIAINGKPYNNRLYFATSLIAAYDLTVNFNSYKDNDEYIIFKIDSSCLSEYNKDPLFIHGIWVDYSISKKYIIETIRAESLFGKFNDEDFDKLY